MAEGSKRNHGITPYYLQVELCEEIERLCKDLQFKRRGRKEAVKLKAYRQQLPLAGSKDMEVFGDSPEFPDKWYEDGKEPDIEDPVEPLEDENVDAPTEGEESYDSLFPWALVQIDGGSIKAPSDVHRVNVTVVVGVYDDSKQNNGHDKVMLVIERIIERFAKYPLFNGKFTITEITDNSISNSHELFMWGLSDPTEDSYPYYFGVLSLAFRMTGFVREDEYA